MSENEMNDRLQSGGSAAGSTDEDILRGIRRRMTAVEGLIPVPPAWRHDESGAVPRPVVRLGIRFAVAPLILVAAIVVIAVGAGLGARSTVAGPSPSREYADFVYRLVPETGHSVTAARLDGTAEILRMRIDSTGAQAEVTEKAPDLVTVRVFGRPDETAVKSLLGRRGSVEFVLLPPETYGTSSAPRGTLPERGSRIDPALPAQFSASDLDPSKTVALIRNGLWEVAFAFNSDAAAAVETWSGQHVGDYFAIVVDGVVQSAPYIAGPITGGAGEITSNYTESEAKDLATVLQYGALPLPIQVVSVTRHSGSDDLPTAGQVSTTNPTQVTGPQDPETTPEASHGLQTHPVLPFGGTLSYRVLPTGGAAVTAASLATMKSIAEARLAAAGIDAQVVTQSPDRLEIRLTDAADQTAAEAMTQRGVLEFVPLPPATYGSNGTTGSKEVPAAGDAIDPALPVLVASTGFDPAGFSEAADTSTGAGWLIDFALTPAATTQLSTWTTGHVNDYMALVLDGQVLSVPYIRSPIMDGKGAISGSFSRDQAKQLAGILGTGPLPMTLQFESSVAPASATVVPSSGCSILPSPGGSSASLGSC